MALRSGFYKSFSSFFSDHRGNYLLFLSDTYLCFWGTNAEGSLPVSFPENFYPSPLQPERPSSLCSGSFLSRCKDISILITPLVKHSLSEEEKEILRKEIQGCGIPIVGFGSPIPNEKDQERFRLWWEMGYGGEMSWLYTTMETRMNPRKRFPWAETAIVGGVPYDHPANERKGIVGRIARYARGKSYHRILPKRLKKVTQILQKWGGEKWYICVDTGPLMEKVLAVQGGIGWIGKNTLLIHPQYGSYIFLCVVLTDLVIPPDPPQTDQCGACTRCIQSCPTNALLSSRLLDSRLCISYLTIEHRGEYTPSYDLPTNPWIFGCDICQEVCPYVKKARKKGMIGDPVFLPLPHWETLSEEEAKTLSYEQWDFLTRGTDLRRGGYERWVRVWEHSERKKESPMRQENREKDRFLKKP